MQNVAFFTVVYPTVEKYLDDFCNSLATQTVEFFDIHVVNDGVEDFEKRYGAMFGKRLFEMPLKGSCAKIREIGIRRMLQEKAYDAVIFGDSDDLFANNRVEKTTELLEKYDVVVNDVDLVNLEGELIQKGYISKRVADDDEIDTTFLLDKNAMGFTNTAVKAKYLDGLIFDDDLIAIDWCLFGGLIEKHCKAVFSGETISYYRQHSANAVGFKQMTSAAALKGVTAKMFHYRAMSKLSTRYYSLYVKFGLLYERLVRDQELLEVYVQRIRALKIKTPLWWEEIILMEA